LYPEFCMNMNGKSKKLVCDIFSNLLVFEIKFGAVGAGAESRYGSGSTKMMRLWLRNTGFDVIDPNGLCFAFAHSDVRIK
jgi:hypothetical protein